MRPALVLMAVDADLPKPGSPQRLVLCQITSHSPRNADELPLLLSDFQSGRLDHDSTVRPTMTWMMSSRVARRSVGHLKPAKFREVADLIYQILTR